MTNELECSEDVSTDGYEIVIMNDESKRYVCKLCIGIAWNTDNKEDMKSHVLVHTGVTN